MIHKLAISSSRLHPIISARWSPRAFDEKFEISQEDINALLEAARWSPSASNHQPWRYIVAKRGDSKFNQISETLDKFNHVWAPKSSLFIVACAETALPSGKNNPTALYDVGLSVAFMCVEASYRGFVIHQMAGFNHDLIKSSFALGATSQPIAIIAIGIQAEAETLGNEVLVKREKEPRSRKELAEILL